MRVRGQHVARERQNHRKRRRWLDELLRHVDIVDGQITGNSGGYGGLFILEGELTLLDSDVSENTANSGRGGGIWLIEATATVTGTTVSRNYAGTALGSGGGIAVQDGSTLHLVDSEVADNLAFGFGGGLLMLNSTVTCTATSPGSAGILHNGLYGVYLFPGPFTSTGCDFGEPGTLDDNLGPDVGNSSFFGAAFGDGATFACTGTACN